MTDIMKLSLCIVLATFSLRSIQCSVDGGLPFIDKASNNDPISETDSVVTYKIGADFCIPSHNGKTYAILCDINANTSDQASLSPITELTWSTHGIVFHPSTNKAPSPVIDIDSLFSPHTVLLPINALTIQPRGSIQLKPFVIVQLLGSNSLKLVRTHEFFAGNWSCKANNTFGTDSATSVISVCAPVTGCGSPPYISNGSPGIHLVFFKTTLAIGENVTYSCNDGYVLSGSATVTCQASGNWSTPPTCTDPCLMTTCEDGHICKVDESTNGAYCEPSCDLNNGTCSEDTFCRLREDTNCVSGPCPLLGSCCPLPLCSPTFCANIANRRAMCTNPSSSNCDDEECPVAFCHTCYFSSVDRDLPGGCGSNCHDYSSNNRCSRRWAICIRRAHFHAYGQAWPKVRQSEDFKCYSPPNCQSE